jgi:hypothetical protein
MFTRNPDLARLVVGDVVSLAVVTLFGFSFHETLDSSRLYRMLATLLPLSVGWFLVGAHVGVFDLGKVSRPSQLWRPVWTMVLAGPLAGLLRAIMLASPAIVPIFVLVLMSVGAAGMLLWRVIFLAWITRRARGEAHA